MSTAPPHPCLGNGMTPGPGADSDSAMSPGLHPAVRPRVHARARAASRLGSPGLRAAAATLCLLLALPLGASRAAADAAPVGPLTRESVSTVSTTRGALVALALPHSADGLTWRLARNVDPKILRQVAEADVDGAVVIVFEATGAGTARVSYALTHGDESRVFRAVTQVVRVR